MNSNGYYESGNAGIGNSYSLCQVNITTNYALDLTFSFINYAESSYDYGTFGTLDASLLNSNTADTSNVQLKCNSSTYQLSTVQTLKYSNISAGTHYIQIKYRKDGSVNNNNDSLQFKWAYTLLEIPEEPEEPATNLVPKELLYDEESQFFYFVDGKYPQSYVGNTLNATLNEQFNANDTGDYCLTVGGVKSPVFTYDSNEYLAFEPSQTVTVNLDGANVTFSSGSTYFFAVEPIVWRVSDYGVSSTDYPAGYSKSRTEDLTFKAVSDLVLDWGAVETGDTTEGWAYTSSDMCANINSNYTVLSGQSKDDLIDSSFLYSGTMNFDFDSFSARGKQNPVTTTNTSTSGIFQASLSDLSANLSDYRAYASDFVCMLAGVSDTQWCTYATRDLQNLGSGIQVLFYGTTSSLWLSSKAGVRLSYAYFLEGPPPPTYLKSGDDMAKLMTNYWTCDVTSIIFDYVKNYDVATLGTGVDASLNNDGSAMIYGAGTSTVYVLSESEMFVTDPSYMFNYMYAVSNITFNNFNTSLATTMEHMFDNCYGLTELDLSGWDTSKVTNMSYMFCSCGVSKSNLSLDLSGWDTSKVTNMSYMFDSCFVLTELDLSGWDTSNVINMSYMFNGCSSLTELDLSPLNTSNVTNMSSMFSGCSGLTELDLSSIDTSNVTDMSWMFYYCSSLTELDLSGWDTSKVTNMSSMFWQCSALTTIYVSDSWSTAKVTNSSSMFSGCTSLVGGNGTTYNANYTDKTYARIDTASTPGYLTKAIAYLKSGDDMEMLMTNYWTCEVTSIIFDYAKNYDVSTLGTGVDASLNDDGSAMIYGVGADTVYVLSDREIYITDENYYMFPRDVTNITFNNFNTSEVTTMDGMFAECDGLTELDLSGFDTSNVTEMHEMFARCTSLTSLDLSSFDTSNVTGMGGSLGAGMFSYCSSLTSLDLSGFDTSNVTNMREMFAYCSSLTSLDLSSWDTSNVTDMSWMFEYCSSLTSLDLSSFDTSKVTDMSGMFYSCSALTTIYVSNSWSTAKVKYSSSMFYGCTKLVGGNGTKYNSSYVDKTYARIDTASRPGYLTYKAKASSVNEDERAQKMTITTKIVWAVCGTVFAVVAGVFVWLIVFRRCRNSIAKRDILRKIK